MFKYFTDLHKFMALSNQLSKMKENWLLIVLALLFFLFFTGGVSTSSLLTSKASYGIAEDLAYAGSSFVGSISPSYYGGDFAPEIEERQLTKTAVLSNELDRGTFESSEAQLNNIVSSADAFMLYQNVREQGLTKKYKVGSYQIKVDSTKYDAVISQLQQIGEVTTFTETTSDVTGTFLSLEDQIDTEQARLTRYNQMYSEAIRIEDKITLNDRIFNQERIIKNLENSLANLGNRVEFSTISFTMQEKQSEYANIALVKISQLVKNFVSSLNSVFVLFVTAIPYAVAALILWLVYRFAKRRL